MQCIPAGLNPTFGQTGKSRRLGITNASGTGPQLYTVRYPVCRMGIFESYFPDALLQTLRSAPEV